MLRKIDNDNFADDRVSTTLIEKRKLKAEIAELQATIDIIKASKPSQQELLDNYYEFLGLSQLRNQRDEKKALLDQINLL